MDNKFNEQKDILIAIKKEINLLHQQVDYLIRNEKSLELLDLDVMMNRTHTIYDLMCGVEVGSEELGVEDEELPVGLDEIRGLFGVEEEKNEGERREELEELEELEEREELGLDKEEAEEIEENEGAYFIDEAEDLAEEEPVREPETKTKNEATETEAETAINETVTAETMTAESSVDSEDRGFILNFEPVEESVEEEEKEAVYTSGDEVEMKISLEKEEEELEKLEDLEEQEGLEKRERIEDAGEGEQSEDIAYEPVVIGDMEEKEDGGFELEVPETLGDRLQQGQDPTLADRLQHSALNSLQSAIGINDKFLFVNELFNGSMEKYNRSIANLDDLKTLNGALIYLNELRIELQWNSSNEAYKKLLELVHRKFGA